MIQNRSREATLIITFAIVFSLAAFYFQGEQINNSVTGYAVIEEKDPGVIVAGIEFKVLRDGQQFNYIFSDKGEWYMTSDDITWEKRVDMGKTMWIGLYYLQSSGALIFWNGEEVTDLNDLARKFRNE